jgi:hypothetical protein
VRIADPSRTLLARGPGTAGLRWASAMAMDQMGWHDGDMEVEYMVSYMMVHHNYLVK